MDGNRYCLRDLTEAQEAQDLCAATTPSLPVKPVGLNGEKKSLRELTLHLYHEKFMCTSMCANSSDVCMSHGGNKPLGE